MEHLNSFLNAYGTMLVFLMLVAASAVYIIKIMKDIRKRKPYNAIAEKMGLNKLPASQDISALYGDKIAEAFPGYKKNVIFRYGGVSAASLSGEFFCTQTKTKVIRTVYSQDYVCGKVGVKAKDVKGIDKIEYDAVIFRLGKPMPDFKLDFEALRGLYDNPAAQNEAYSKYFNKNALEFIINSLPSVSICSAGNSIIFYEESDSVKDMPLFVHNVSKAAEMIISGQ